MSKSNVRKPSHPGPLFKRQVLDELGIDITTAAEDYLGVSRQTLSSFVNGKSRCTQDMAAKLALATGTGVAVWINMQAKVDAWNAEKLTNQDKVKPFGSEPKKKCA